MHRSLAALLLATVACATTGSEPAVETPFDAPVDLPVGPPVDPPAETPVSPPEDALAPASVHVSWSGAAKAIELDGEPFTTFHFREGRVPYMHPLFAPGGLAVTRGFPMAPQTGEAHDHPHHVSLWFAHGDVNGHDFWHDAGTRIDNMSLGVQGERIDAVFHWEAEGEALVREDRRIEFGGTAEARWLDLEFRLTPMDEPLVFGDTKEGTFALRLAPTLRVDGEVAAGSLLDSEGREDGAVWGKRARWVAARGPARGPEGMGEATVAIFDAPTNPRHPTTWHARTYGLVAANPFGRHAFEGAPEGAGDMLVEHQLVLRYRVWLSGTLAAPDEIQAAYADYAASL